MSQLLAVILAVLIACPPAPAQQGNETFKSKVLTIPAGSVVEVRFVDNSKMRGRLGAVSDTGFDLQSIQGNKVETRQIGFDGLKSIRDTQRKSFAHSVATGFLSAGIVIVSIIGTIAIVCETRGCFG